MMPPTEDGPILEEVDEVHQELLAHVADEAGGMPADTGASSGGKDGHLTTVDALLAL